MTTITCDLCHVKIPSGVVHVELRDGEHPHNGDAVTRTVDVCADCIKRIPGLRSDAEFEDLKL